MRESKYDSLLNVSIVILIVSSIMLGITGYNIFFKGSSPDHPDLALKNHVIKDSLRTIYNSTLKAMDNNMSIAEVMPADKDTKAKLAEMLILRTEIDSLMAGRNSSQDLATAKIKIEELQLKVKALQDRYTDVAGENKKLRDLLNSLIAGDKNAAVVAAAQPVKSSVPEKQPGSTSTAFVSGLHLFAVSDQTSKETGDADLADKIVGSFYLKNISASADEVMIVVLQPDGKVIKNSVWESGSFDSHEGKKIYSRKLSLEPGVEEKQLNFSLVPEHFLKGDYIMQVWYNGSMLGKMVRTLS